MSEGKQSNGKLHWDGTVTAGAVLAAIVITVPMIGGAYLMVQRVDSMSDTMFEFSNELKELRKDVNEIKLDLATKNILALQVSDHESRLRQLERGK